MNKKLLTLLGVGAFGFFLYEINTYEKPISEATLRIQETIKTMPVNVWERDHKTVIVKNPHDYALVLKCGNPHSIQIFNKGQSIMKRINTVFRIYHHNGSELTWFMTTPIDTPNGLANRIDNSGLYFLQSYGRDNFTVRIKRDDAQTSFNLKNAAQAIAACLKQ